MGEIHRGLAYVPRYLSDFGSVLSGPKRTISERHTNAEAAFGAALTFLCGSVVVIVLLCSVLPQQGKPFGLRLAGHALEQLIEVSLFAVVLWVAWAAVGARTTVRRFLVTYAYFAGVVLVIPPLCMAVADGVLRVFEPELYEALPGMAQLSGEQAAKTVEELRFFDRPAVLVAIVIWPFGFVGAMVWALIAWGAFRQLHGVGRPRSLGAFVIAGALVSVIVAAIVRVPPFPLL